MSSPEHQSDSRVVIVVVRSGGVAGIRRHWQAEPPDDDAPRWIELIERCPWDDGDDAEESPGADRFIWRIRAQTPGGERERELPESRLSGPWRELVDAVRDATRASSERHSDERG